jgi:hypothetical protein
MGVILGEALEECVRKRYAEVACRRLLEYFRTRRKVELKYVALARRG